MSGSETPADLDDVTAELYAADPSEFVAARKDAATAARKAGDRKLATAIGKLRKPTTVGWLVNLLVRAEPDDIAELFDLGNSLRDAQRRSAAGKLKELSAARQQAIRALTRRAAEIAEEHGRSVGEDVIREVGQTLGAGLADPEVGERVRAGRVVTAESYSGFGPAVLALAPEPEPEEEADTADAPGDDSGVEDTGGDLDDGNLDDGDLDDGEGDLDDGDGEEPDDPAHEAALTEAQEQLDRAREDLDEAREDEDAARAAAEEADAAAQRASEDVSEAKQELIRLRAELHEAEEVEAQARAAEKSTARESRRLRRVHTDAHARAAELQDTVDECEATVRAL